MLDSEIGGPSRSRSGLRCQACTIGMGTVGACARVMGTVQAEQRSPPVKALAECAPQGRRVCVPGARAAWLDAGELHQTPAGVNCATRLVRVEPEELTFVVAVEGAQRSVRAAPACP